jgi:hypothetical protein
MELLNPSGWFIPNSLGYLDNPGLVPLSQLTDGQFRPSTGGKIVRTKPMDMHLFDTDPMAREIFQRAGCLSFCQNMQRGHPEVAKLFALNFDGKKTRVGDLEFEVTETSISTATGIPISGEKWFKAMVLSSPFVKYLFNPEY